MNRHRVLLAEDDYDVRDSLRELLEARGFDVVDFGDATGVASYMEDGMLRDIPRPRVHALLTDLRMPNMDGVEMLERFHALGWELPVVVVTAFGDPETRARVTDLGAAAVLDKPVEGDELVRTLRRVIAGEETA